MRTRQISLETIREAAGRVYDVVVRTPLVRLPTGADAPEAGLPPEVRRLTPAEVRVLRLIAEFKSSKEIAEELGVHYRTVENHRSTIASKLGLVGKYALSRYAALHRDRLR